MNDREVVHYQPHGRTTVCGAVRRAVDMGETNLAGFPKTTNISAVNCPKCREYIRGVVANWSKGIANV